MWMGRVVAGGSRLLPALDPLLERRGLALVLHADPVRVVGRRGLIARGRRGHGLPRRLAGERRRFRLRGSKRRPYRTEHLFGLGAEIGWHHRARGLRGRACRARRAAAPAFALPPTGCLSVWLSRPPAPACGGRRPDLSAKPWFSRRPRLRRAAAADRGWAAPPAAHARGNRSLRRRRVSAQGPS